MVVPRGFTVTGRGGGALLGSSIVSFTDPTLAAGASVTYTVVFAAPTSPRTAELGAVSAASPIRDPNPANNSARRTITIT